MFKKIVEYISQVRTELSKVSWPTRSEMWESAKIILILCVILAAAVFAVDNLLSFGLEKIL
ncbi:preprotein translocase subunit SecE [candidate division KSB1 bacterium]|nr:MAG: preprotein translocase subunit SecE [candidate division KSB1 bacterium]